MAPSVTFARDVVPGSVSASTVSLLDGRTGTPVQATVTYDGAARTETVTPTTPLYDNTPYRLTVSGVADASGATTDTAYSSTFQTVDVAPPAVGSFTATGALRAATLTWTSPAVKDLDHYIVRMATGPTPPSGVTTGTGVYSGPGTSVSVPNLVQGTTYSFRIWARDRSGKDSPSSSRTLVGTAETMSSTVTSLTYGGAVTLSSRLTRRDTGGAIAGVPVQLLLAQGRHHGVEPHDDADLEFEGHRVLRPQAVDVGRVHVGLPRFRELRRFEQRAASCGGPHGRHRCRQPRLAGAGRHVHDVRVGRAHARGPAGLPPEVCR